MLYRERERSCWFKSLLRRKLSLLLMKSELLFVQVEPGVQLRRPPVLWTWESFRFLDKEGQEFNFERFTMELVQKGCLQASYSIKNSKENCWVLKTLIKHLDPVKEVSSVQIGQKQKLALIYTLLLTYKPWLKLQIQL